MILFLNTYWRGIVIIVTPLVLISLLTPFPGKVKFYLINDMLENLNFVTQSLVVEF